MPPLTGRRALVTGGTRGIGRAIARRLTREGATVTITGTRDESVRLDLEGCAFRAVDFSRPEELRAFATDVAAMDLDVLVNNAGINVVAPFCDQTIQDFERIQQVNVHAPFLLARAAVAGMRQRRWGRIVNICSIWGVIGKEQRAPYSASKFALDGLTTSLAAEVAVDGVLANCVSPGFVDTDLTHRVLGDAGIQELVARVPMRRLAAPEEIAALVAWLAGPENTYISGQNIVIDGGFSRV
jgi:NAD(P)-dependent dehydrogenase (short-subunit alcohol dehydrogenase family)